MNQGCGSCSLCCTLLGVPDIGKAPRMRCWHTTVHGGCAVHGQKASDPKLMACEQFECVWLASQKRPDAMPRSMRPDQSHVVLGPQDKSDPTLLYIQVDPGNPQAWKQGEMGEYIQQILDRGAKVEIIVDEERLELGRDGGSVEGRSLSTP